MGERRNFQVFEPLDFLAELTQHIPNKGEHLIRYYGHYSNKARGMRARQAQARSMGVPPMSLPAGQAGPTGVSPVEDAASRPPDPSPSKGEDGPSGPGLPAVASAKAGEGDADPPALSRSKGRRWAMLIQRVYQADPLRCPRCGGTMKIIAFIEAHQPPKTVIGEILQHCGLWVDPPSRSPPKPTPSRPAPTPGRQGSLFAEEGNPDSRRTHEVDPDFLEFLRREDIDEPEPVWEP